MCYAANPNLLKLSAIFTKLVAQYYMLHNLLFAGAVLSHVPFVEVLKNDWHHHGSIDHSRTIASFKRYKPGH